MTASRLPGLARVGIWPEPRRCACGCGAEADRGFPGDVWYLHAHVPGVLRCDHEPGACRPLRPNRFSVSAPQAEPQNGDLFAPDRLDDRRRPT